MALLSACSIFDVEETIPAYVEVTAFSMVDTLNQPFTDYEINQVWAFMDGKFIGTFGLPARFPIPVIEDDQRRLQLYPGVHADRMEQARVQYPFYDPDTSIIGLRPKQVYQFPVARSRIAKQTKPSRFQEGFEFENIQVSADLSQAIRVDRLRYDADASVTPPPQSGAFYGASKFRGNPNGEILQIFQTTPIDIPRPTLPIYLECWYRCTRFMAVGIYATSQNSAIRGQLYQQLVLNPSPTWKKVYVYLYDEVSAAALLTTGNNQPAYDKFQVIFRSDSAYDATDFIAVDNLRLMEYK